MVKLGMIVRADAGRGLAEQTRTFWEHLNPAVTVVVDMSLVPNNRESVYEYPGSITTQWRGYANPFLNPDAIDALVECDVIYTAETHYDERLATLCKSVLHVNPELFRHQPATRYWYPSSWMVEDLPPGERVTTPIRDADIAPSPPGGSLLLHVAGHRAIGDRNGTTVITGIIQRNRWDLRLAHQDGLRLHPRTMQRTQLLGNTPDRWAMYEGASILVYPRRYGGQSLVVNEAMARGLAVVMGDNPPNLDWPIAAVPVRTGGRVKVPYGVIQMWMVLTQPMTETLTVLLNNPDLLDAYQVRSLLWARDNAWSQQLPRIRSLLEDAAS